MAAIRSTATPLVVRLLHEKGDLPADVLKAHPALATGSGPAATAELLRLGLVSEEIIAQRTAEHLGRTWLKSDVDARAIVEVDSLGGERVIGDLRQLLASAREPLSRVSDALLRARQLTPVLFADGSLHIACLDPTDFSALEELRMLAGHDVVSRVVTRSLFKQLMQIWESSRGHVSAADGPAGIFEDDAVDVDVQRNLPGGRDTQVLRIVNNVLLRGLEEGASDIHLEPYEGSVRLRYRVDGQLKEVKPPPAALLPQVVSRIKILSKMDIAERRLPQDGAISVKDGSSRVDLRVSTIPTIYGEKVVLRVLEKNSIPENLESLGLTEKQAADFDDAANSRHGLVFVTGPTGSGKSTTLYCALNRINQPERNIATVEDPVEYKLWGLNQVQVSPAAGLTFANALRAFLRQDPDVIMVGEVRDTETASICMRAAMTGHLVMSTLHANGALQVVGRLMDMGIEPFLLGPALRLLQAQRLVRHLCGECRQPYELPGDAAERFGLEEGAELYRSGTDDGCLGCRGSGFQGRTGVFEVIRIGEELQEMIAQRASHSDLKRHVVAGGTELLADNARRKLLEGVTTLEEVADYVQVR